MNVLYPDDARHARLTLASLNKMTRENLIEEYKKYVVPSGEWGGIVGDVTPQQAVAEMKLFHFHSVYFPHLARYVEAFPAALGLDQSLLAGFAPATANSPKP